MREPARLKHQNSRLKRKIEREQFTVVASSNSKRNNGGRGLVQYKAEGRPMLDRVCVCVCRVINERMNE